MTPRPPPDSPTGDPPGTDGVEGGLAANGPGSVRNPVAGGDGGRQTRMTRLRAGLRAPYVLKVGPMG